MYPLIYPLILHLIYSFSRHYFDPKCLFIFSHF
ncbi:DUF4408 domain-containing protein [Campylobacter coli]|nr:DUF4408 domain-containing protein [Campylobacter coli]